MTIVVEALGVVMLVEPLCRSYKDLTPLYSDDHSFHDGEWMDLDINSKSRVHEDSLTKTKTLR